MPELDELLNRAERVLERFERLLPDPEPQFDASAPAYRWRRRDQGRGGLWPIPRLEPLHLNDVLGVERQKAEIDRNTRQFVAGRPANNVLLWGARGTGKSSLIKALANAYTERGLRVIEVDRHDLVDLPEIVARVTGRPERFILYCDDLSFDVDDASFKSLKAVLDGSVGARPENLLIYATSNRRHLMPEPMRENLETQRAGEEIHPGESVEERISLSDRFGLWLSFYPFDREQYLAICRHWLERLGAAPSPHEREALNEAALEWGRSRGSHSGRTAWQFARDRAGRDV